jgi:hypothetical protein
LGWEGHKEFHAYLDAPHKKYGWAHRLFRHDIKTIEQIASKNPYLFFEGLLHLAQDNGLVCIKDIAVTELFKK